MNQIYVNTKRSYDSRVYIWSLTALRQLRHHLLASDAAFVASDAIVVTRYLWPVYSLWSCII